MGNAKKKLVNGRTVYGIKVGSATVVRAQWDRREKEVGPDQGFINRLCDQIHQLITLGYQPFLVTSGAVASDQKRHRSRNLRAAVGQNRLMNLYTKPLHEFGLEPAQFLLTARYLDESPVLKNTLNEALAEGVVPIINANDTVDDKEMQALGDYADNDNLFFRVCELVGAPIATIGFDQPGLLDDRRQVIHQVRLHEVPAILERLKGRSRKKKGIYTKVETLAKLAAVGVRTTLVPGRERNSFVRAVEGEKDFGTVFLP